MGIVCYRCMGVYVIFSNRGFYNNKIYFQIHSIITFHLNQVFISKNKSKKMAKILDKMHKREKTVIICPGKTRKEGGNEAII